jgi:hypothetical protein
MLAVRGDDARTDALRAACDDDFAAAATTGTFLAALITKPRCGPLRSATRLDLAHDHGQNYR